MKTLAALLVCFAFTLTLAFPAFGCERLVAVKYRGSLVCLDDFEAGDTSKSSWIRGAWYDRMNQYMVINLKGTAYHHCRVPAEQWNAFLAAPSHGKYYGSHIKGRYYCRLGGTPSYGEKIVSESTAGSAERITFAKGEINHTWSGNIADGEKRFKLALSKGQSLRVAGPDVYTWKVITPDGNLIGCDRTTYCSSLSTMYLPSSGDYTIITNYRMSSCATCPAARTRKVTVSFEAY
jgi:hypothetical protein